MTVHIIHLPERDDRWNCINEQFIKQGIPVTVWPGIKDVRGGFFGISRAHKQIIQWAKSENQPFVIIAEDDCCFTAPGAWAFFLDNIPADFDLYLSSIYTGYIDSEGVTQDFCGLTLYICHQRFYDRFLGIPDENNIDRVLGTAGICKVCPLFTTYQMDSYSDNKKEFSKLGEHMEGRKIFGQ